MSSYKLTYDQQQAASITPTPPSDTWNVVLVWTLPGVGSWMKAPWLSQSSFLSSFNTHASHMSTSWEKVGAQSICLQPTWSICWCEKYCPFEDSKQQWPLKCKRFSCVLWPASEAGQLSFLLINPLRWIRVKQHWLTGVYMRQICFKTVWLQWKGGSSWFGSFLEQ